MIATLRRLLDAIAIAGGGPVPPPAPYQGLDQCAPGVDAETTDRVHQCLNLRGPQPKPRFRVRCEEGVIWPESTNPYG